MRGVLFSCVLVLVCAAVRVESSVLDELVDLLSIDKRACAFKCADGSGCLKATDMCNNYKNCNDGSDEDMDRCKKEKVCLFTCGLTGKPSRTMCVKKNHLCDGKPLCDSGLDEDPAMCEQQGNCLHSCEDRYTHQKICLKKAKICNRQPDCQDKSDESYEACKKKVNKAYRQCELMCPGENEFLCVRPDRICDGKKDCEDTNADELKENCYLRKPRTLGILEELLNEVENEEN